MATTQALDRVGRTAPPRSGFPALRHFAEEYLLALPVGVVLALLWSGLSPESYFAMAYRGTFLVNDVALTLFIGLLTKEIVEATARGGVLHSWRRLATPLVASGPAAIVPIALFAVLVRVFGEPMLERGWLAVLGVDLVVGYFVARLIFGRHAAVAFFLLLGIAANALGFLALGIAGPVRIVHPWLALTLTGAGVAMALTFRARGIRELWPYLVIGGGLSWLGLHYGGLHGGLALIPIVPFIPGAPRDPGFFVDAGVEASDPLNRFERLARVPAQIAIFFFGLVNAGAVMTALEPGVFAMPLAALVGRPAGLLAGVAIAAAAGLHRSHEIGWRDLVVIGVISAGGFTMALVFATLSLGVGPLLAEIKASALVGAIVPFIAIPLAWALRVGRFRA